ncbi:MAG: 1,4-alpha-glucan branching protein domain-containing protein [Dehalococcoidia bacterium]
MNLDKGAVTFVLHTHLPYCRLAGRWPHGEEWLHEAMLECYLPLLRAFRRLADDIPGSLGVTINLTPVLAEQIRDELINRHFAVYLAERIERAETDVARFAEEGGRRAATAEFHRDRYRAIATFYHDTIQGDVLGGFRALEESGHIEIATCAATHGYLPLLDDDAAVRFQVQTGVESHERNFGRRPRSFWLPECAYEPGLERFLEEAGVKVFFVETHLVTGGRARGKALGDVVGPYAEMRKRAANTVELPAGSGTTFRAYHAGQSNVSVIARNEATGLQVWSAAHGYPGDGLYREFHKKDETSGLHYWRVTGAKVDLGDKDLYDPGSAAAMARSHADHFRGVITAESGAYHSGTGNHGLVAMAYDTELFGHWWLEGVDFLEETIRRLAREGSVELTTAGAFVEAHPPTDSIDLPEGSWGNGGDHRTWLNPETAWTWPEIHSRQRRAATLLASDSAAADQLGRELLLLQSSDWQFLMTTGQAHDYAIQRFREHAARFDSLANAMEANSPEIPVLVQELYELDNPFPAINPAQYGAAAPAMRA